METFFIIVVVIILLILLFVVGYLCAKAAEYIKGDASTLSDPDFTSARLYFIWGAVTAIVSASFLIILGIAYVVGLVYAESETAGLMQVSNKPVFILAGVVLVLLLIGVGTLSIAATVKTHESPNFKITTNPGVAYEYGIVASVLSIGIVGLLFIGWIILTFLLARKDQKGQKKGSSSNGTEMSNIDYAKIAAQVAKAE